MTPVVPEARRTLAPVLVAGATVAASVTTIALAVRLGTSPGGFLAGNEASQWLGGLSVGLVGAAVLRAGPSRLGPLLACFGLLTSAAGVAQEYAVLAHRDGLPGAGPAAWLATFGWIPGLFGTLLALPLLFPDGALPSRRWRTPTAAAAASLALAFLLVATTQQPLDDAGFGWATSAVDLPFRDGPQLAAGLALLAVPLVVALAATLRILARLPKLTGEDRVRNALFAVVLLLGLAEAPVGSLWLSFALNAASSALVAVALLRYRLFDVEAYLPRTLGYLLCVAATLAVYLLTTTLTTRDAGPGYAPALVTAVTAFALANVLGVVNRLIGRLLFGDRARPYRALMTLGDRLAGLLEPDDVLPVAVETVCRSLRLPYAAITLAGESEPGAMWGSPPPHTTPFVLGHAGEQIGVLTVGLRPGERSLADADERALTAFAHQVALAAHGVRATRELRRSREQVVVAREAERGRLHRDLHDGIGPALAGISLGLETASRLALRDPQAAAALLADLGRETSACVDDLRHVITGLRPPVLAEVGLVGALTRHAELLSQQSGRRLVVEVSGTTNGLQLPPAVEVAAYRIATEALTNLARHSTAARGTVHVACDDALRLLVEDDGHGTPPIEPGNGLTTMRHRAEELGGQCTVTFRPGRGTSVVAELPLRVEVAAT
jgi:signal transduction histidine kinase